MKSGKLLVLLFSPILIFFSGCGGNISKVSRPLLGTVVTITIADGPEMASDAFKAAFSEIESVQKSFSIYDQKSEISIVNRDAYIRSVKVSDEVFYLVHTALDVSAKTGGAFDITWASAGRLWDFSGDDFTPPDDKTIKSVLPYISYKNVLLDEKGRSIRFLKSGTKIGLGGIAKGYAVQRAVAVLRNMKIKGAIVAAAGEIQVIGSNMGKSWKVGIQDPRGNSVVASFDMNDGDCVSTSGDYERFRIVNGKRYHHIIDPATGYPADSGLISVTVFSHAPFVPDGYGTAFFVSGIEKTKRILASLKGVSVVLVDSDMTAHVSSDLKGKLFFRDDVKVIYF